VIGAIVLKKFFPTFADTLRVVQILTVKFFNVTRVETEIAHDEKAFVGGDAKGNTMLSTMVQSERFSD
jgi:hypothetical protein